MAKNARGRIRREERQREAVERVKAFRALPVEDRLNVVMSRRGQSKREVKRLTEQLSSFKKIRQATPVTI